MQSQNWVPLEANPEVWNAYKSRMGVLDTFQFVDVYGFDPDLLAFISKPVAAVILLFPVTKVYEDFRALQTKALIESGQSISPNLYFTLQKVGNACGSIALIHALLNGIPKESIGSGALFNFYRATSSMDASARGDYLIDGAESMELARLHKESSLQGQTAAPNADDEVNLHFVCFVRVDGSLYELDGAKPFPVNHGPCLELLDASVNAIREFMTRDPDNLNFSTIALASK